MTKTTTQAPSSLRLFLTLELHVCGIKQQRSVLQPIIVISTSFLFPSLDQNLVRLTVSGLNPPLSFPWLPAQITDPQLEVAQSGKESLGYKIPLQVTTIQRSGTNHSSALEYCDISVTSASELEENFYEQFIFIFIFISVTSAPEPEENFYEPFIFIFIFRKSLTSDPK